jgi:hypothetical protein
MNKDIKTISWVPYRFMCSFSYIYHCFVHISSVNFFGSAYKFVQEKKNFFLFPFPPRRVSYLLGGATLLPDPSQEPRPV